MKPRATCPPRPFPITTPLTTFQSPVIAGKKPCIVSICGRQRHGRRLTGAAALARVGHIGLYRDHDTLQAIEYYFKVPDDIAERTVFLVDMLATGNSGLWPSASSKRQGAAASSWCLLSAPEG